MLLSDYFVNDIFVIVVHEKEHHYERVGHMVIKYAPYHSLANKSPSASITPWPLCFHLKKRRTIRLG
jgi:hypothetical protein